MPQPFYEEVELLTAHDYKQARWRLGCRGWASIPALLFPLLPAHGVHTVSNSFLGFAKKKSVGYPERAMNLGEALIGDAQVLFRQLQPRGV